MIKRHMFSEESQCCEVLRESGTVRNVRMLGLHRWILALGLLLGGVVACGGPQPACPNCPTVEFHLVGPSNLIVGDQAPVSGQTWGRVELLLSPKAGNTWSISIADAKLTKSEGGWVFSSQANESTVVSVRLRGTEVDGNVNVTTMSVSVWLGASDVNNLTSANGLKLRLRLNENLPVAFDVLGYVWQATNASGPESCKVQFSVDAGGSFATGGTPIMVQGECSGDQSSCWKTCGSSST